MPAAMHSFYLRNMYLENKLIKKDALSFCGTPIDLTRIITPAFILQLEMIILHPGSLLMRPQEYFKALLISVLQLQGI